MRVLIRASALAALLCVGPQSCQPTLRALRADAPPLPGPSLPRTGETRAVVLVTIDGVRPTEIWDGVDPELARTAGLSQSNILSAAHLVPNLYRLAVQDGVGIGRPGVGSAFRVSGKNHVSMPGYLELLAGRTPVDCLDNACRPAVDHTLVDDFRAWSGRREDAAVFTSWSEIHRVATADEGRCVVSAGRAPGSARDVLRFDGYAERLLAEGDANDTYPGYGDYRPDRKTTRLALRYLAAQRPTFLYVALGDTDEHAHRGDYGAYVEALRDADRFVGEVVETVTMLGEYGRGVTVIVTTDHGRSAGFREHWDEPESAGVWLIAAGGAVPRRGIVGLHEERALADVRATVQRLMGKSVVRGRPIGEVLP